MSWNHTPTPWKVVQRDEGRVGDTPVTLDTVAALVCADIAASYAESIREDDQAAGLRSVPAQAAE